MSTQDDITQATTRLNEAATKANTTTDFFDNILTGNETQSFTNPNNGKSAPSVKKATYDRTDELFSAAESDINQAVTDAQTAAGEAQAYAANSQYVEERVLGVGVSIYRGTGVSAQGNYVQNGDVVPVGTTHLAVLINGRVEDLVAWDELTLPAVITTAPTSDNGTGGYDVVTNQGTFEFVTKEYYHGRLRGELTPYWGVLTTNDSTQNQTAFQKAINYRRVMGAPIIASGGEFNCKPLTVGKGFHLKGVGNRFASVNRNQPNVTAWMCDLVDNEDFLTYTGSGFPQGDVSYTDCAFVNLNNYSNPLSVIAGNNRAFWAVDQQDDVYLPRWIQRKTGGQLCPKLQIERVTYVSFFAGHDVHTYMAKFSDITSYTCAMAFRAYGTSIKAELIWPNDSLWCGYQLRGQYCEIGCGSAMENAVTAMQNVKNGIEFHNGFGVINGVGQEAAIDNFIWAYNGVLQVNTSRPATTSGSVCKNILWVEAFCKVTLNDCYQPGSFLNDFTVAKERFATDNITMSPIPATATNLLPILEHGYDSGAGVYKGIVGNISPIKNRTYIKPVNINSKPRVSGSEIGLAPVEWGYEGDVVFDGALEYSVDYSIKTGFRRDDAGTIVNDGDGYIQFDIKVLPIKNNQVDLDQELANSGVNVIAERTSGVWSVSYQYYGEAEGMFNDESDKLITAVLFTGSTSTLRFTVRNKVMIGLTQAQRLASSVRLLVEASGTLPLTTGENDAIVTLLKTN